MKKGRRVTQTDKGQFDEVLRRMIKKNPQKTSEIKRTRPERWKNPETDPNYLPVFDGTKRPEQKKD